MQLAEIIGIVLATISLVGGAVIGLLKNFYKTSKEADSDYQKIKEEFDTKLEKLEKKISKNLNDGNSDLKKEIEKISAKLDNLSGQYVTINNFKLYADSVGNLLQVYSDRTSRLENSIDSLSDNIISLIKRIEK